MNKIMLIGNIGKDPELQTSKSGNPMCYFPLATSEKWTQHGEKKEKTTWHNIVIFGKLSENVVKFKKKGDQVFIEGKIDYSVYTDKEGNEKHSTKIICENLTFLDSATKKEEAY